MHTLDAQVQFPLYSKIVPGNRILSCFTYSPSFPLTASPLSLKPRSTQANFSRYYVRAREQEANVHIRQNMCMI